MNGWRRPALFGVIVVAIVASAFHRPLEARASCAPPAALAAAPVAFVGTVTDLSNGGRVATVRVDDVWRGMHIPATVRVVGTPDLGAAATSVDRSYTSGAQYLFVPSGGGPETFMDNTCTLTQLYSAQVAALRPADAPGAAAPRRPADAPPTNGTGRWPFVLALITALVLVPAGAGLLRRRSRLAGRGPVGDEIG